MSVNGQRSTVNGNCIRQLLLVPWAGLVMFGAPRLRAQTSPPCPQHARDCPAPPVVQVGPATAPVPPPSDATPARAGRTGEGTEALERPRPSEVVLAPLRSPRQERPRALPRSEAATGARRGRQEAEPRLEGRLHFNGQEIEVFINDRLVTLNRDATREAVRPDFEIFFQKLFRGSEYSLSYGSDPRSLFAVCVKASQTFSVADLLENLTS